MSRAKSLTALSGLILLLCILQSSAKPPDTGVDASKVPVTFCSNIAPILQRRCQECHHDGGIGPMSLVTYDEVRPYSRDIEDMVLERLMPPFHAGGKIGRYIGDPRLTDDEIASIKAWVESGSPKGDPMMMPPPRNWPDTGWTAGKPDLILTMPKPFEVKPTLSDGYAFFVFDYIFPEDTWTKGLEVKPGDRSAVHHANVYIVPPGIKTLPNGQIDGVFDPTSLGGKFITAWEPGSTPLIEKDGAATLVAKGSRFAILMHYIPTNKPLLDQTSVGFYFANGLVKKQARILWGGTHTLNIPANDPAYTVADKETFQQDSLITAFSCHLHLRGKSFQFRIHYPDGRVENAVEVPRWDVNWQQVYELREPMFVPKGTVAEYVATWDNSARNRVNPDPNKAVHWGDTVTDEMMDGYVHYVVANENLNLMVANGHPKAAARGNVAGTRPATRSGAKGAGSK
ncbi:MAG TPA: hypothetical protein VJX67_12240 [Blastocatellia bacterium]|nr:hypothetical protein [Blastocatellia bacterium]